MHISLPMSTCELVARGERRKHVERLVANKPSLVGLTPMQIQALSWPADSSAGIASNSKSRGKLTISLGVHLSTDYEPNIWVWHAVCIALKGTLDDGDNRKKSRRLCRKAIKGVGRGRKYIDENDDFTHLCRPMTKEEYKVVRKLPSTASLTAGLDY